MMAMPMPLARTCSDEDEDDDEGETIDETGTVVSAGSEFQTQHDNTTTNGTRSTLGNNREISTDINKTRAGQVINAVRKCMNIASIEPLLFLFRFAMSICDVTIQSFYMETICYKENLNDTTINCTDLTDEQRISLEKVVAEYFRFRQILEYGVPIFFVLLMGQYVDRNGSKFPLLFVCICSVFSSGIYILLAFIQNLDPKLILVASAPLAIGGTFVVFLFAAMKHISSNTTIENRSFRIAIAEIIWYAGSPVGLMAAIPILKYFGYKIVFALAAQLYAVCFVYTVFLVKSDKPQNEVIPPDLIVESSQSKCRSTFSLSNIAEAFRAGFRKRNGSRRIWLLTVLTILFCRFMALFGDLDMAYLYTHNRFHWNNSQYSIFQTTAGVVGMFGSIALSVVSFSKMLPMSDALVGLISSASTVLGLCVITWAEFPFMMYLGAAIQIFSKLIPIVSRSLASKIVAKQEVGKIFSLIACIECIAPLIATLIFNSLFIYTANYFPGAVYLLCSAFVLVCTFLYFYLFISMRGQQLHQEVEGHPAGVETH